MSRGLAAFGRGRNPMHWPPCRSASTAASEPPRCRRENLRPRGNFLVWRQKVNLICARKIRRQDNHAASGQVLTVRPRAGRGSDTDNNVRPEERDVYNTWTRPGRSHRHATAPRTSAQGHAWHHGSLPAPVPPLLCGLRVVAEAGESSPPTNGSVSSTASSRTASSRSMSKVATGIALHPLVEALRDAVGDASGDGSGGEAALAALVSTAGIGDAASLAVLAGTIGIGSGQADMAPPVRRRLLMQSLQAWLLGQGGDSPLRLVVEDLHWSDPSLLKPAARPHRPPAAAEGDAAGHLPQRLHPVVAGPPQHAQALARAALPLGGGASARCPARRSEFRGAGGATPCAVRRRPLVHRGIPPSPAPGPPSPARSSSFFHGAPRHARRCEAPRPMRGRALPAS